MSNADCEYPNPCDCGCQDEPTRTGCKCCGREDHHATDCLIPENARLRARIAELEADVMRLASSLDGQITRAAKAEAERDEAKERLRQTIEKVADQRLDGYRALGQRAADAENRRDAALLTADFDDDETAPPDLCEACQRTERAKAALRAEVNRG